MLSQNTPRLSTPQGFEIVELLGDLTSELDSLADVPRLLVSVLNLDRATFTIARQVPFESDQLLVSAVFDAGDNSTANPIPDATSQKSLANLPDPIPLANDNGHARSDGFPGNSILAPSVRFPVEKVRRIDALHKMVLILHWGKRCPMMSVDFMDLLNGVCDSLAKSLRVLLAWREKPELLGGVFHTFTPAQWQVLCQLCSDLSEKELAASLNISPHTLHSHIKATYQKLGVRGRLSAVRHLRQAVRHYRAKRMGLSLYESGDSQVVPGVREPSTYFSSGGSAGKDALSHQIGTARNALREFCSLKSKCYDVGATS